MSEQGSTGDWDGVTPTSTLSDNLEKLSEKRSSTREEGLSFFLKLFRKSFMEDYIIENRMTLLENLKKCLKRGSNTEQILAPTVITLISLTLGGDESESIYKEFSPIYGEFISKGSKNPQVFSSIIDGLGLLCFLGSQDDLATMNEMNSLKKVFSSKQPGLAIASALNNWGLLLTTLPVNDAHRNIQESLQSIVATLQSDSVEVRMAGGLLLALVVEISKKIKEGFNFKSFSSILDVENLLDTIRELGNDRSKGKREKDKQKGIFRQVYSYLESGEVPSEQLSFKHQKFEFDEWTHIIRLDCIRECLGEGLHVHFGENELVHEIFNIQFDKNSRRQQLSQLEKRLYMSPNSAASKNLSLKRSKQRDAKGSDFDQDF